MKGSERNVACPCGSGLKRKRCESHHPDLTPSMTPEMEERRLREQVAEWYAARRRGRAALQTLAMVSAALEIPRHSRGSL